MDVHTVLKNVGELSSRFAAERNERQKRRALVYDNLFEWSCALPE